MEKSINEYRDLLTVEEVAEVFRVHKSTVYKLIKSGELRALKLGREYKCPKSYIIDNFFNPAM
jgi:excisionase family DNA binding protein